MVDLVTCPPPCIDQVPRRSVVQVVSDRVPEAFNTVISPPECDSVQPHYSCNLLLEEELKNAMPENNQVQHRNKNTPGPEPVREEVIQQLIQRRINNELCNINCPVPT